MIERTRSAFGIGKVSTGATVRSGVIEIFTTEDAAEADEMENVDVEILILSFVGEVKFVEEIFSAVLSDEDYVFIVEESVKFFGKSLVIVD